MPLYCHPFPLFSSPSCSRPHVTTATFPSRMSHDEAFQSASNSLSSAAAAETVNRTTSALIAFHSDLLLSLQTDPDSNSKCLWNPRKSISRYQKNSIFHGRKMH
mmetsp:Transcript_33491/g.53861  ORF Transcript_33491/g.53861 Transcript_33491/m.53861 type:complete len:104 (-) Transcript_33491:177-488(-)